MKKTFFACFTMALIGVAGLAQAKDQPVLVPIPRLSLDMAVKAGQAAIAECRKQGVQIAVTIVDRGGHPQLVMRDVLAMDLTLAISRDKAYTAMSFNAPTSTLEKRLGQPNSIGKIKGIVASAGGLPITAGGSLIGGIGVSGAPSGLTDEKCAHAGLNAINADLEMGSF